MDDDAAGRILDHAGAAGEMPNNGGEEGQMEEQDGGYREIECCMVELPAELQTVLSAAASVERTASDVGAMDSVDAGGAEEESLESDTRVTVSRYQEITI